MFDYVSRSWRTRRAIVGVMVGTLVAGLVAAGPATGADDGKVTIDWFVPLGAAPDQAKARKKAITSVVKAFNKGNPGTKLRVSIADGDVHEALGERISDEDVPDVIGPVTLRELSGYGDSFADLTPLATAAGFDLGAFDPALVDAYRGPDGSLLGLPFGAFPSVMYYNEALFDEAGLAYPPTTVNTPYVMPDGSEVPWNYDTVREIAKLLTIDANGNDATSPAFDPNAIVQFGFHDQYGEFRRTATLLGGPADLLVDDGSGAARITIPESWRTAETWLHDAIWADHIMPTGSQIASPPLGNNPFGSGHVAMAAAPLWYTCCISDAGGTRLGGWDLAALPAGLTGDTTSPLHADVLAIGGTSAYPDQAFAVLDYLLNDPRAGALWAVAPAASAKRQDWYAGVNRVYPDVTNWAAADAMFAFADVRHQANLPAHDAIQQRLSAFSQLLLSDAGEGLDLDAELDRLEADLQAIAAE